MVEIRLLVGDIFMAECKEPTYIPNTFLTKLKRKAYCILDKESSEKEFEDMIK